MRQSALDQAATEHVIDAARRFALRLSGAVSSLKTYPVDHPSLQFSYRGIAEALVEMMDLMGPVLLEIEADEITIGDLHAALDPDAHEHVREMVAWLKARDIRCIRCEVQPNQDQVQALMTILVEVEGMLPGAAREEANRRLGALGIASIQLEASPVVAARHRRSEEPSRLLLEVYLELATLTEDLLLNGPRSGTLNSLSEALPILVDALTPRSQAVPALISATAGVAYEARHAANVTILSIAVGARLGLDRDALIDLGHAVSTMDVGMRVLPTELRRAGRDLTDLELATLHTHPIETVRAHLQARVFDGTLRRRLVVGLEQHLGVRRQGYPEVHRWPSLHLFSRIASACDAFDALTSSTGWRRGLTPEQALSQLQPPADKSHDPVIVAELCGVVLAFPPACRVRLSDQRLGTVTQAQGPGGLPIVRVDGEGEIDIARRGPDDSLAVRITEILLADASR